METVPRRRPGHRAARALVAVGLSLLVGLGAGLLVADATGRGPAVGPAASPAVGPPARSPAGPAMRAPMSTPVSTPVAPVAPVAPVGPVGPAVGLTERPLRPAARAAAVLAEWDRNRARAYARADLGALRRLYTPGSPAGRADAAVLRTWTVRGLAVPRLRVAVLSVQVRRSASGVLVLRVRDRVAGLGRGSRGPAALPQDRVSLHRVVLHRDGGLWRVHRTGRGGW